jgi:hypothetical protein
MTDFSAFRTRASHRVLRFAVLGTLVVGLAACGSMSVTMEVLNPEVVQRKADQALVATGLVKLSGATDETIELTVRKLKVTHRQAYVRLRDLYLAEAAAKPGKTADALKLLANSQLQSFSTNTNQYYADLASGLRKYRDDLRDVLNGNYSVSPTDARYWQVVNILKAWDNRLRQVSSEIADNISSSVPVPQAVTEMVVSNVKTDLAQISLQNSPFAFSVANAPDSDWSGGYNNVYTTGQFGATDVAIKLDPHTGNYLLKGLSFDPSDVAAVAAKVTTQALLLSAQIAGVPVKSSAPVADGTAGKALAASSTALADAQAGLEARRAQDQARKSALLALASVILSEEAELAGDDARRRAAVAAIRAAFEARQPALLPPATR